MGKVVEKKRIKRELLLNSAYELFTSRGINETSISDIVKKASLAKGTFYLYFKDKVDIKEKLVACKVSEIVMKAYELMADKKIATLEEQVIFLFDYFMDYMSNNKMLMKFIINNFGWGVFQKKVVPDVENENISLYDCYRRLLEMSGRKFKNPEMMLFMAVELVNAACHGFEELPEDSGVTRQEMKEDLYPIIIDIIKRHEIL